MIKKILFVFLLVLFQTFVRAQGNEGGFEDTLRSNGKIYVVVAVLVTIFAGIVIYLIRLDRKISRLEKKDS